MKNYYEVKLGEYREYSNTGVCLLARNCCIESEEAHYHATISACAAKDLVTLDKSLL
jgi:hypothetical protein